MVDATLVSRVTQLPAAERLEMLGAIWQTFGSGEAPVSTAEKALLDERLAEAQSEPDAQSPWSDVQQRMQNQLP